MLYYTVRVSETSWSWMDKWMYNRRPESGIASGRTGCRQRGIIIESQWSFVEKQHEVNPKRSTLEISGSKLSENLWGSGKRFINGSPRHIWSIRTLRVWPRLETGCLAALHSRAKGTNLFSGAKRSLNLEEEAEALTWNLCYTFSLAPLCLCWGLFP